jgi:deazaflavin-dependent oxidoreductase (nitroreductase family)
MPQDDGPRNDAEVIEAFRSGGGQVGGWFTGASLVLLTSKGARTGSARTTPLAAVHEADRIVVHATNAGAEQHPAWLHNVRAHPVVEVEVPGGDGRVERFRALADELGADESARLLDQRAEADDAFAAYRDGTVRRIPAVALRRLEPTGDSEVRSDG